MDNKSILKPLVRSAPRSRTPSSVNRTLNTTSARNTSSNSKKVTPGHMGNVSRFHSNLNTTAVPKIKRTLCIFELPFDWDLECSVEYGDYLIATFEAEELKKVVEHQVQDYKDQLQIHKDILHHSKLQLQEKQKEIRNVEALRISDERLDIVQTHCDQYLKLCQDYDFGKVLQLLERILEHSSKQLYLKNIKPVDDETTYNQLLELFQKFLISSQRLTIRDDIEEMNKFGNSVKVAVTNKNKLFDLMCTFKSMQKCRSFNLIKKLSDHFAEQNRYHERRQS